MARGEGDSFLDRLVRMGITWHFGGMADPFQPINEELKITNQIVSIANRYGYSILFSTKSDTVHGCDIRPDVHSFQLSVTNICDRVDIEPYVPGIEKRLKFFRELKSEGFKVGIRIQPFIPGISGLDIVRAFEGADHFTIEGLKVVPQNDEQKEFVFRELGLEESHFTQMGLLNLRPEIRYKMYQPLIEYFKNKGISYSISDNDMRYLSNNSCCCGDALIKKSSGFDTTALLAKYNREYRLCDILREIRQKGVSGCKCNELFTSNRTNGCVTVEDFYRERFKKRSSPFSPNFQYVHNMELFDK